MTQRGMERLSIPEALLPSAFKGFVLDRVFFYWQVNQLTNMGVINPAVTIPPPTSLAPTRDVGSFLSNP